MPTRLIATLLLFLFFLAAPVAGVAAVEGEEAAHATGWFETVSRIINFLVLAGLVVFLLRKPLASYLDAKTEQIRQELADAHQKREQAQREREQAEAKLSNLEQEIAAVKERARAEADAERVRILEAAEEEASRLTETARKEISAELELARRNLLARATELSVELARKKIADQMNDRDRKALVERSIEKLKEVG